MVVMPVNRVAQYACHKRHPCQHRIQATPQHVDPCYVVWHLHTAADMGYACRRKVCCMSQSINRCAATCLQEGVHGCSAEQPTR